eukprot:95978_1
MAPIEAGVANTSYTNTQLGDLLDLDHDDGDEPNLCEYDGSWRASIPIEDNSVSKRNITTITTTNSNDISERVPTFAFNRMLTRTNLLHGLSECTPRTVLSKQLQNSHHRAVSSLLKLSNEEMVSMRQFVEVKHGGQINLSQFIELMMYHTTIYKFFDCKYDLLYCIQHLFELIDINTDLYITWSEFTSYLVDAAVSRVNKPKTENSIRYATCNTVDTTQHNNVVVRVQYLSLIDAIVSFEKNSRVFRVYSKDLKLKRVVRGHRGFLLDIVEIPGFELIAISSADQSITFWKWNAVRNSLDILRVWDMNKPILSIEVCGTLLFCGDSSGTINAYSIGSKGDCKYKWAKHNDCIMKLLSVESVNALFSASMDANIGIWDVINGKHIALLKGHQFGVLHLQYCVQNNLLFSAGQDSFILIWQIETKYLDLDSHDSQEIKFGHKISISNSIVQLQFIQSTNELIACDLESVFRVFAVKSIYDVQCLQVWNAANACVENIITRHAQDEKSENQSETKNENTNPNREPEDWSMIHKIVSKYVKPQKSAAKYEPNIKTESIYDFTLIEPSKEIVCSKGSLVKFIRLNNKTKHEDSMPIIAATLDMNNLKIIGVSSNKVYIFDALTGQIVNYFDVNIIGNETHITACCFDPECKRLFIATDKCQIAVFNIFTGTFLNHLEWPTDAKSITHLIYCARSRKIITTSSDGWWCIHDDDCEKNKTQIIKHEDLKEITACCVSDEFDLLAIGDMVGHVQVYQITNAQQYTLSNKNNNTITALLFIHISNTLYVASCDSSGFLSLWSNTQLVMTWQHSIGITSIAYANNELFVGDENGNLSKWQLSFKEPPKLQCIHNALHGADITGVQLLDNNSYIMTFSSDAEMKILDTSALTIHGIIRPDSNSAQGNKQEWNVELQSIEEEFEEIRNERLSTIIEEEQIDDKLFDIQKRNLFRLTQIQSESRQYNKVMCGIQTDYVPIHPQSRSLRSSTSMMNIRDMKQKKKKKKLNRSKSSGWLSLVPKTTRMLETDPLSSEFSISIGEKVMRLDEEEAEVLAELDKLIQEM